MLSVTLGTFANSKFPAYPCQHAKTRPEVRSGPAQNIETQFREKARHESSSFPPEHVLGRKFNSLSNADGYMTHTETAT